MAPSPLCVYGLRLPSPPLTAGSLPATILSRWWPRPIVARPWSRDGRGESGPAMHNRSPWWDGNGVLLGADMHSRERAEPSGSRSAEGRRAAVALTRAREGALG